MVNFWFSFLKNLMRPTWRLPGGYVPSARFLYLNELESGNVYWVLKYLKRRLFFELVMRQFGRVKESSRIDPTDREILWINRAAPSLGDSLMDLAARTLLMDRNITLLTDSKNVELYCHDIVFKDVYKSLTDLKMHKSGNEFDLVICDAFSPRVMLQKFLIAPNIKFLGLYGFVNGFEVHRTYFAFARMQELLGVETTALPIRPSISFSDLEQRGFKDIDVCIAVGGEWPFRTYDKWISVIGKLLDAGLTVSLVGSQNGNRHAAYLIERYPCLRSTVGKLDLNQVVCEISRAKVFLGADGGLWHIACSIPIPSVVLFADCQLFDQCGDRVTRETSDLVCEVLYDDREVSNISPDAVYQSFDKLWGRLHPADG